ncbi:MAG TPA: 50S ribosomal protein L25 [Candidatus Dormibacteraeota bacterium]|nr:50S ribosomal protein L25 [Candidatus Dormibacteraeota bacterium]
MSLTLSARPRSLRGRHAATLRRDGLVPAVVYGHQYPSLAIEVDRKELERLWRHAGQTLLVDLAVDGHPTRRTLIRALQFSPRSGRPIHVDFFAVNLLERTTAEVPLVLTGEAPAEAMKLGTLLHVTSVLRIEALPVDLPGQIHVDVSVLTDADSVITVGDLELPAGVTVLAEKAEVVAKISARRVREADEAAEDADTGGGSASGD